MLSLKRIEAFVAVCDELSFTAAAKKLNVAQPWLSQQVRLLEEGLGVTLLHRTNRKVELTPHGKEYLSISRELMAKYYELLDLRNKLKWQSQNRLRLGSETNSSRSPERNLLVADAVQKMPGVKLQIIEDSPARLFEMLEEDLLDVVITHLPEPEIDVESIVIARHEMVLLVPKEFGIAGKECIALEDIRGSSILGGPRSYHTTGSQRLRELFEPYAVQWVSAPTDHFEDRILVAQARRLSTLIVDYPGNVAIPGDMALRRIKGCPLIHEMAVMKLRGQSSKAIDRFWTLTRAIGERFDATEG